MTDRTADTLPPHRVFRPRSGFVFIPRRHAEILIEPPVADAIGYLRSRPQPDGRLDGHWRAIADSAQRGLANLLRHSDRIKPPATDVAGAAIPRHTLHSPASVPDDNNTAARPWIITGHQVEFYHAGVWAKVLLADTLAKKTGGTAVDILVDHDTVDHLGLALPQKDAVGNWSKSWHTWDYANSIAADGLPAPSREAAASWSAGLLKSANESGMIPIDALQNFISKLQLSVAPDYVPWLATARAAFERELGINVRHVRSSELCGNSAWLAFVITWISNAAQWAAIYNQAITDYRRQHHIKSPARPVPPLAVSTELIELPFWIYRRGTPRERLTIQADGQTIIVPGQPPVGVPPLGDDPLAAADALGGILAARELCIRPRALTLTLYVRTFLSDLFIHGIGGAMYDEMTDQIANQIGLPIGGYQCASAGWLLPAGQKSESHAPSIPELIQRRHHLKHNPQLIYQNATPPVAVADLLAERSRLITALARRSPPADTAARAKARENFARLHAINARCHEFSPMMDQIDRAIADARLHQRKKAVLGDREYFFALHGWHSLRELQQMVAVA
jgi:hypothetical protein